MDLGVLDARKHVADEGGEQPDVGGDEPWGAELCAEALDENFGFEPLVVRVWGWGGVVCVCCVLCVVVSFSPPPLWRASAKPSGVLFRSVMRRRFRLPDEFGTDLRARSPKS